MNIHSTLLVALRCGWKGVCFIVMLLFARRFFFLLLINVSRDYFFNFFSCYINMKSSTVLCDLFLFFFGEVLSTPT